MTYLTSVTFFFLSNCRCWNCPSAGYASLFHLLPLQWHLFSPFFISLYVGWYCVLWVKGLSTLASCFICSQSVFLILMWSTVNFWWAALSLKGVSWFYYMSTFNVIWLKQSQILTIIYLSGCIWHVCTQFPSRKMLNMPPAATASPLGASHLHANCWTAARLPTAEPPSTGWRKSTKAISRLPGTEEGPSADVSQRGRGSERDRRR